MGKLKNYKYAILGGVLLSMTACKSIHTDERNVNQTLPTSYNEITTDSLNSGRINWNVYFKDDKLRNLISMALENNQEWNISLQEILISKNEIQARIGEYIPSAGIKVGTGVDKVARYTNIGAMEATTDIKPGKEMPEPLGDFQIGMYANWELDVWGKLHNSKEAAVKKYLATVEGQRFMQTQLISEIAESYYELLALDNELQIVQQNIEIQNSALNIVKLLKQSARSNELAVKRFEAQVLKTTALQYEINQKIIETENKINYIIGRFPQKIERNSEAFDRLLPEVVHTGFPADILNNRPDIRAAELNLEASKLDIKVAKAKFYPSLGISAEIGYRAFNPKYLFNPESILYSIAGELMAPLVNRKAIKSDYLNANAKQIQSVYKYEQCVLNAYIEIANQLSKIQNLEKNYELKTQEVTALSQSVTISNDLFKSARADYMEVLLTQREALESKFELIEIKMKQLQSTVALYKALGGGWTN